MNDAFVKDRWSGKGRTGGTSTRMKRTAAIGAAALAASALSALPASGTVVNVGAGHNITVFHNIDFVAVFGYELGEEVTVQVRRNGVLIGTATGQTVDTPEGAGLEVNHGPEGAPLPGDCWQDSTPDIRPGDRVSVQSGTGTDSVVVDNIRFTGQPRELGSGDIVVPFIAKRANGTAIPASFIDSAEFRAASNNQVRFEGAQVVVQRQPGGAPGEYWQRYNSPFKPTRNDDENPFGQAELRRALLGDGHATGFGHVAPLPLESMLHDGLADTPGPALGCEGSPSAQWAVTNTTPGAVNLNNRDRGLTVRGLSHAATAVTVSLTDSDPATPPRTVTKAATLTGPAAGRQTWTASFTQAQLRGLNGRIRVGARHTTAGGQFAGTAMSVLKDVVAPNAPRASVPAGTYNRTKRVALRTGANNQIRFTLGDGSQARPTRNRGAIYRGQRIRISSTQVLKAIAIDRVGNVSPLLRNRYRIR